MNRFIGIILQSFGQFFGQGAADISPSRQHLAYGAQQLIRSASLRQIPGCAGSQRPDSILLLRVHAEYQNRKLGVAAFQVFQHIKAASAGHGDVQQDSPSSTLSSASLPSDSSSTTMSSGLSAGARPTWPRLAPQSSHIGIEERTISLRSKPIDVYLITDLNQSIGQSTSKSLKYVLRSRMIILHRIHQKPEMTGERALLNVPHGEPKPSRAYLFVSLEIVPFTTDAFWGGGEMSLYKWIFRSIPATSIGLFGKLCGKTIKKSD